MLSHINQFFVKNLLGTDFDIVHCTDPCHLIGGFEILRDALCRRHLFHNQLKPVVGLNIYFRKVIMQSSGSQQIGIKTAILHWEGKSNFYESNLYWNTEIHPTVRFINSE